MEVFREFTGSSTTLDHIFEIFYGKKESVYKNFKY